MKMQISCSRAGALVYTVRTKPCRWSIDFMTTQESLKKFTTWRSSFLHLLPAQLASLDIVQNYCNLGKTFSSSTGSCLHIGIMFSWMYFCDLNCLELCSWWFWSNNLHHFVHKTAATLFWETWKHFMKFFSIQFCHVLKILTLCTSQTCIMWWSWILAWIWSSHYNL